MSPWPNTAPRSCPNSSHNRLALAFPILSPLNAGCLTRKSMTSRPLGATRIACSTWTWRSEEHTSELQSHLNLVCRLLLEKKNKEIHIVNFRIKDYCSYRGWGSINHHGDLGPPLDPGDGINYTIALLTSHSFTRITIVTI